jgi:hypothetical protein
MNWLVISAVAMTATAIIHSVAGEKRLIGPALKAKIGIFAHAQSRAIMRGAWHLTSLFMLLTAAVMVWPRTDDQLKTLVAVAWLAIGLYSLISTRGRHVGWPTLTLAGVSGLLGSLA